MASITILLVEDDDIDARAISRAFAKSRISNDIVRARDGNEGLSVLRGETEHAPLQQPYVVLLDLNMPGMNGFEFLEELRRDEQLKKTIVFVLTTSDNEKDLARAYESFISGYIVKSRAGNDFVNLVTMLDVFEILISFPKG